MENSVIKYIYIPTSIDRSDSCGGGSSRMISWLCFTTSCASFSCFAASLLARDADHGSSFIATRSASASLFTASSSEYARCRSMPMSSRSASSAPASNSPKRSACASIAKSTAPMHMPATSAEKIIAFSARVRVHFTETWAPPAGCNKAAGRSGEGDGVGSGCSAAGGEERRRCATRLANPDPGPAGRTAPVPIRFMPQRITTSWDHGKCVRLKFNHDYCFTFFSYLGGGLKRSSVAARGWGRGFCDRERGSWWGRWRESRATPRLRRVRMCARPRP
mgnify:CR=1 FL=1